MFVIFSADREKHVRPGAPSEPNEYNFNYRRRGVFLIFNNKHFNDGLGQMEREGTDVDAERLEERFQDTGFEVRRYDDVTCARMTKLMHEGELFISVFCLRFIKRLSKTAYNSGLLFVITNKKI